MSKSNRCTFFNVLVTAVVSKVLHVLKLNLDLSSTSIRLLFKETSTEMKQQGLTVVLIARSKKVCASEAFLSDQISHKC